MGHFLLKALAWVIVIVVVAVGAVRIYAGRDSEVRSWAGEFVAFDRVPPRGLGHYLTCPAGTCGQSADAESPVFPVSAERLHDVWIQTMARDPRLRLVKQDEDGRFLGYVQRSSVLGLPDIISVQFVPMGETRSSIKIFSAARYEDLDFGATRRRVEEWVHRLMQNFPEGMASGG